jgi:glyoxylase-like metal-dependent hydrolase (beta-lactamase superfamily II)
MASTVIRFDDLNGTRIYQLALRAFPSLIAHAYVIIQGDYAALIDTGSGSEESNADLEAGLAALRAQWDEHLDWDGLNRIIITHAHPDHYGGLNYVRPRSAAPIAIHALDLPVLRDRSAVTAKQAAASAAFLRAAGFEASTIEALVQMYGASGRDLVGWEVATVLADGDLVDGRFAVVHTPGHCAGQVCLCLGDVLFCADHILAETNPRLIPASLEPHNGLAAYLRALDRVAALPGIRLALAGHEASIGDVYGRIAAIRASHLSRLDQIRAICATPRTIAAITAELYPNMRHGPQLFVATQAVAARVEYLLEQGRLIAAHATLGAGEVPVPLQYVSAEA